MILNLPLLGNRDYVNGATIFDAIVEYVTPSFPFTVRFNSLIHGAVEIAPIRNDKTANGLLTFSSNGEAKKYGLFEAPSTRIERVPYDEAPIFASCRVESDKVLSRSDGVSTISRFIVMYKALMKNKFPDAKGKWLFTGATVTAWPASGDELCLQFAGASGTRIVRARALIDGREVSQILFSLTV
ncbi:MAG: hypothetical protein J0H40_16965 [Rhizobiales bacterium]|nr:hypothetical protein [Hyphomicrobiales bacterium]